LAEWQLHWSHKVNLHQSC